MKTLTIELEDELARKFNRVAKEKRDMLLKIWVERVTSSQSLSDLFEFTAEQAKRQGLTEERLTELLKKE